MLWNPQIEISALFILILFIFFFRLQRYIPVLGNMIYHFLLITNLVLIVVDLTASYTSSYFWIYPTWLNQILNMIYYFTLFLIFHLFDLYTRVVTYERSDKKLHKWKYMNLPLYFMVFLLITNPWTSIFFSMDNLGGFSRQLGFYYIITPFLFYHVIAATFILIKNGKNVSLKEKFSLFFFVLVTISGVIIQSFIFKNLLIISGCFTLGIAVIFLAMQNPEYDFDPVTRIYNQECMQKFLNELVVEDQKICGLGIGIYNYKNIRSIYGEKKNSYIKREIGLFLKEEIGEGFAFYITHGRFALLLPDKADKLEIKRKIEQRFEKEWNLSTSGSETIKLDYRFIYLPEETIRDCVDEIIDVLKVELYDSQYSDISRMQSIDNSDINNRRKEREVIRALYDSIDNKNLKAYYQPIYDSENQKFISAEALARIEDPKLGIMMPGKFISLAEEDGTILRLGNLIFREVCSFIKRNNLEELGLKRISVNLSPIQCLHENLVTEYVEIAEEFGVDFKYINFEITETAMIDLDYLSNMMEAFMSRGAVFSLDDYGTGYSNLVSITKLPLSIIKIDKSILWAYYNGTDKILPHLIKMFIEDGYKVLCEGIEKENMSEGVKNMGAQYEQGYLYSKPLPEDEFLAFLSDHNNA